MLGDTLAEAEKIAVDEFARVGLLSSCSTVS